MSWYPVRVQAKRYIPTKPAKADAYCVVPRSDAAEFTAPLRVSYGPDSTEGISIMRPLPCRTGCFLAFETLLF